MSTTKWFVTVDSFTNEALAYELSRLNIHAEEAATEVRYRGKRVSVWQIPYEIIDRLQKGKMSFPFRFIVLVQEGGGGVRRWNLQHRGNLARQKAVRDAKKMLARTARKK